MKTLTNIQSKMKTLVSFFMLILLVTGLSAQNVLPVNKATGKVSYKFSIPVSGKVSNEKAYELVCNWFSSHAKELTRSNTSVAPENMPGVNANNLQEVANEFKNSTPVQSLDPSSNRLTMKVVTKYFGESGGNIRALYLQCYMLVTVTNHKITCELSDFSYNHFNEHSYRFKRILNWSNSTSLDPVSTLEYLVENEQNHAEFSKFYSFLNKDVKQLIEHFTGAVKAVGALASN